jgi:uncharacterized membrane protein (UPF0127 family)
MVAILIASIAAFYYFTEIAPQRGSLALISEPCQSISANSSNQSISALSSFAVEGLCIVDPANNTTVIGGLVYVASTSSQQIQGFQDDADFGNCNGNATLSLSCVGMIFVTTQVQSLCFWMHNTEIPLQQVWISASSAVVATFQAQPFNDNSVCHNAQFVLETSPSPLVFPGDKVEVYDLATHN